MEEFEEGRRGFGLDEEDENVSWHVCVCFYLSENGYKIRI